MEVLKNLLDNDEIILWMKDIRTMNLLHKDYKREYKFIKSFYPNDDEPLKNYSIIDYITNKHLIIFIPDKYNYPYIYKTVDISHIYEYRREFCFFNLDKLTEITIIVNPKKDRYQLGLYFELFKHNIIGDDAPNCWFNKLTIREFEELLEILKRVAPNAKIIDGHH